VEFADSMKKAFLYHWNLLAFGAGVGFAALAGPVALPALALVVAGEVAYLGLLGTHPPMSEEAICERLEISMDERRGPYRGVQFFNHEWDNPAALKEIVYEMRFDPVSARYAEFGPFFTGLVLEPADACARVGLRAEDEAR